MHTPENKLLACMSELNPQPSQYERMRDLISQDMDADRLIDLADREGLTCLLYKNLEKSGLLESLSPHQRERLRSSYYRTAGFNLKLIHDLKEVLALVGREHIRVVLLQGMDLLHHLYDDIGLRPLTDIDIWVLEKDSPSFTGILSRQGYLRDSIYPNTFRKGSTTFDLHTHLLWADRIEARKLLLKGGEKDIYQKARRVDIEGQTALILGPYDQVLYLSLHALKHHMTRLIWLVDIKSLLADLSRQGWEELIQRARDLGQEKTLSYILFLLIHLFHFQLPPEGHQLTERKRPHILERRVLKERIKGHSLPFWAPVFLFSSEKGLRRRFSLILESVFPRPEILRQIFPDSADLGVGRLYLKRLSQILKRLRRPLL